MFTLGLQCNPTKSIRELPQVRDHLDITADFDTGAFNIHADKLHALARPALAMCDRPASNR
jgi:hypothetical protein